MVRGRGRPAVDGDLIRYEGPLDPGGRNGSWPAPPRRLPHHLPRAVRARHGRGYGLRDARAAFGVGAVRVVEEGVGGSWVPPGGALTDAVRRAVGLDRRQVREAAVERFDHRRMVDAYEDLYRRLAEAR